MLRSQHLTVATSCHHPPSYQLSSSNNEESAYLQKCKHFIMVVNYGREQLELGLIQVLKITGELNNADLHTKKLRDKSFAVKADNILTLHE